MAITKKYKYTILTRKKGLSRWNQAGTLYKTKAAAITSANAIKKRWAKLCVVMNTKVVSY